MFRNNPGHCINKPVQKGSNVVQRLAVVQYRVAMLLSVCIKADLLMLKYCKCYVTLSGNKYIC